MREGTNWHVKGKQDGKTAKLMNKQPFVEQIFTSNTHVTLMGKKFYFWTALILKTDQKKTSSKDQCIPVQTHFL